MAPARAVWPLGPRRLGQGGDVCHTSFSVCCSPSSCPLPWQTRASVPQAASSCPNGWHAWSSKCFLSPPLLSRHDGCATICKRSACARFHSSPRVGSQPQEESDFVAGHVLGANKHWIGLHRAPSQRRLADDPWRGEWAAHDLCGNGSFDNWRSQADPPFRSAHSVIVDGSGQWHAVGCARAEYRCLCELMRPRGQIIRRRSQQSSRVPSIFVATAVRRAATRGGPGRDGRGDAPHDYVVIRS